MDKEIIIHIGMPKTGTTALQDFLFKNRDYILNNFRIYYPTTGLLGSGHHGIRRHLKNLWDNFQKELFEQSEFYDRIIISSEDLSIIHPSSNLYEFLMNLLSINDVETIKIITYLRRQDIFLESSYKQVIEDINVPAKSFFIDFLQSFKNRLMYFEKIKKFQEKISNMDLNKKIIFKVLIYETLEEGNIIIDFFNKLLGIDLKAYPLDFRIKSNPSISVEMALALRQFNEKYKLPREVYEKLIAYVESLDKQMESKKKYILSLRDRLNLLEFYRDSNEKLFREFFMCDNLYVLSDDEKIMYTEFEELINSEKSKTDIEIDVQARYELIKYYVNNYLGGLNNYLNKNVSTNVWGYKGIFGWIDNFNKNFTAGWVFNSNISEAPEVELLVDGYALTSVKCQKVREDIKEIYGAEYPTGFHINWKDINFSYEFLEYLANKKADEKLEVYVREKSSGFLIDGNYREIYVKDIIEILSAKPVIITKEINLINTTIIVGFTTDIKFVKNFYEPYASAETILVYNNLGILTRFVLQVNTNRNDTLTGTKEVGDYAQKVS